MTCLGHSVLVFAFCELRRGLCDRKFKVLFFRYGVSAEC
jgi:hypothetical protein